MRIPAAPQVVIIAALALVAHLAQAADDIEWLGKASRAAKQLNYSGNYVYHHGEHAEVLRVSHRVDGKTERQKVEVLDGPHREFLRVNDEIYCHLADGKTVRVDKSAVQRFFPAVVPDDPEQLNVNYIPKLGGSGQVAGRACQIIILSPRDKYRYTYLIWVDRATSLPLKIQTVDDNGMQLSMFEFSEIGIGKRPERSLFDIRTAGKRVQAAGFSADSKKSTWAVTPPPGYERILEAMRPLSGIKQPVLHEVYSDGMSNFSVFIEPIVGDTYMEGLSTEGAMSIYVRRMGDHKVTTVGEVPATTLLETANSVYRR